MTRRTGIIILIGCISFLAIWLIPNRSEDVDCLIIENSNYFDYKSKSYVSDKSIVVSRGIITAITNPEYNTGARKELSQTEFKWPVSFSGLD